MQNSSKVRYYKTLYIKDCKTGVPVRITMKDATSVSSKNTLAFANFFFFHLQHISEVVHWRWDRRLAIC